MRRALNSFVRCLPVVAMIGVAAWLGAASYTAPITGSGGGSGSQTPLTADVNGAQFSITNLASVQTVATTPGELQLLGTNSIGTVFKGASSNSVWSTNLVGILHKAYASVVALDCNDGNRFRFTNRAASANCTLVITNLAQGQEISISMLGEAVAGVARTVTIVPQLGFLVADLDTFGTALATSKTVTLTNGNGIEISLAAKWEIGTNFADVVTRQYQR